MLPFFYIREFSSGQQSVLLDEDNSRHAVQVLRMRIDEKLLLTDGNGNLIHGVITNDHKKHCEVKVLDIQVKERNAPDVTIAISLTKNLSRFEWFLEKATELGVNRIIPLICSRTEKLKFKEERFQNILVSAMLQSQQCWLPQMPVPQEFAKVFQQDEFKTTSNKYIAHCVEDEKHFLTFSGQSSILFIGPEGDFTSEEISLAIASGCKPVSLGSTRLRTETAGMAASTLLRIPTT